MGQFPQVAEISAALKEDEVIIPYSGRTIRVISRHALAMDALAAQKVKLPLPDERVPDVGVVGNLKKPAGVRQERREFPCDGLPKLLAFLGAGHFPPGMCLRIRARNGPAFTRSSISASVQSRRNAEYGRLFSASRCDMKAFMRGLSHSDLSRQTRLRIFS